MKHVSESLLSMRKSTYQMATPPKENGVFVANRNKTEQNGFYEIGPGELSLNNTQGLFVPTKAFSLLRHSHSKLQQFKQLFRMTRIVLANTPTILQ